MHPISNRWQEPVFRDFFVEALEHGRALVVSDRRTDAIIGSSQFRRFDPADGGSVEIGYTFLSRACWGRGHNREMKRLMVGHALESVARVDFRAGEENCRSRRALEKIGARLAPLRSERLEHGGREIVHLYYELCRADYVASLGAD